jgi:heme-degrading monooxygenase HmoA
VTGDDGPALVSVTDFHPHHARAAPGVFLSALRLREGWYAMPGALGMWLWTRPLQRGRCGSVSVWESEADMRRFVALPAHLAIMRKYRSLGTLNSATFSIDQPLPLAVREAAGRILADGSHGVDSLS